MQEADLYVRATGVDVLAAIWHLRQHRGRSPQTPKRGADRNARWDGNQPSGADDVMTADRQVGMRGQRGKVVKAAKALVRYANGFAPTVAGARY